MRKKLTMFVTGFTVMLVAGAATAQIGIWDAPAADLFASDRHAGPIAVPEAETEDHEAVPATTQAVPPTQTGGYGWASGLATTEKATAQNVEEETQAGEVDVVSPDPIEKTGIDVTKEEPADTTPPDIVILAPKEGQVFEQAKIAYEGKTEPGARVFAGSYEADVDADGNWRIVLILSKGANTTKFLAKDPSGNIATASVTVILEAPAGEPGKDVAFTANQKLGQTAEGYEKFWGTGTPGAKILVASEYGTADTRVGDHGEWYVKLHFEAPPGTVFAARVSDSLGHSKVFEIKVLEKVVKEFSAFQKYGSCSESPPYDVFYGTGAPGTVVEVGSPYESGRTVIGEAGGWDMKVVFEDAPVGVTFEVVLETTAGHRMVFPFTRTEGEAGK